MILDQMRSMKKQGLNESQIINILQDQGISPREINEAISQMNIKDAVSNPMDQYEPGDLKLIAPATRRFYHRAISPSKRD